MSNNRIGPETIARLRAVWPSLLADIAGGAGIGDSIKAHGFSTGEIRAFRALDAEADTQWSRAKEESADALAEEALEHARNPVHVIKAGEPGNENGKEPLIIRVDPAFARVRIDTLKWVSAKRNPKVYSEKAQLDVNVRTVDLTRIISEANARLAQRTGRIIEHEQGASALLELAPGMRELADLL